MADIFISYSSADSKVAREIYEWLSQKDVNVFLAEISLETGDAWDEKIKKNLREADYFIFLASRKACASQSVNQEIGMAIRDNKNIIPVVWDMPPTELPGFLKCNTQAVDMRGKDP
jgi:TIR domain